MSDLDLFVDRLVSFDTETHLFRPGIVAPPLVCGSLASHSEVAWLASDAARLEFFRLVATNLAVIVGANIAFDMVVMLADAFARDPVEGKHLLRQVFAKYERDEVFDVQIAEALNAIARGHLFRDPETGGDLIDPSTGRKGRYSLAICVAQNLGRDDAKKNDFWRMRYAILERVPYARWPFEATEYPKDDARNTRDVAIVQIVGRDVRKHEWDDGKCLHCGIQIAYGGEPECTVIRRLPGHENLHNMPEQARAAFVLQLASAEGLRTNQDSVDVLENTALVEREKTAGRWRELGFLKSPECTCGHVKHDGACDVPVGRGKKKAPCPCPSYTPAEDDEDADKKAGPVVKARIARAYGATKPCPDCQGSGKIRNAKNTGDIYCTAKNLAGTGTGNGCDGTGLDLSEAHLLARTPTGGIKAGRDDQAESGDEDLMGFADYQEDDKLLNVYVPFLRKGIINPRANVLVASGRTSYDEVIQQIPRDGGVRECFEPPPGFVYCSTDYSSGELCTLAQVTLWTVGRSKMAEVINATKDPGMLHTEYGARLVGVSPAELKARIKAGDKQAAGFRQAAKALNFGLPGGMGAAKLVLAKRKKAEGSTTGPDGRKYAGIRFCILVGGAQRCGVEMITEWRHRPTAPVCKRCVELAEDLKREWLAFFDEMPDYFEFIASNVDVSGRLTQLVSERIRGGLSFCDGANTLFQGLLADGAKRSLWLIAREMYVEEDSPLYGSRIAMFFHDETFSVMPEDLAPRAGVRQAELMVQGLREYTPDVHVACEPALMRRWSKGAEPVWRDGALQVWEPRKAA